MSEVISLDDQTIEYKLIKGGSPNLIFLHGNGMDYEYSWGKVIPGLFDLGTLLLFNRAGIGKSSKPTKKQMGNEVIQTVRKLLKSLQLEPPYILIGHSSGGLFANLFARQFPDETQAVVFVDSTHPSQFEESESDATWIQKSMFWIIRKFTKNSEGANLEQTAELVMNSGEFPNIPIVVLTGTKSDFPTWIQRRSMVEKKILLQENLLSLSPNNRHVLTDQCGHFIPVHQPELVTKEIRVLVSSGLE